MFTINRASKSGCFIYFYLYTRLGNQRANVKNEYSWHSLASPLNFYISKSDYWGALPCNLAYALQLNSNPSPFCRLELSDTECNTPSPSILRKQVCLAPYSRVINVSIHPHKFTIYSPIYSPVVLIRHVLTFKTY